MRFTKKLSAHLTPEWRKQYINYEELKEILLMAVDKAPVETGMNQRAIRNYYAAVDEEFMRECEKELTKVNNFYGEKLSEAKRKYEDLKNELHKDMQMTGNKGRPGMVPERIDLPKRRLQAQKLAFSEFYLSLVLLQNYQNLNYTGFRKILKKHDKLLHTDTGAIWFADNVDSAFFYTNKDILLIIRETEETFTNYMEGGDRARAMKRLRVPPLRHIFHPWTTFRVGFFSGATVVLCVVAYFSFKNVPLPENNRIACMRLFRGPLLLIIFFFLIGFNIYGWRKAGVNHVLIFEIDPRDYLTGLHVMEMAAAYGVLWTLCILGFLYHNTLLIEPFYYPLGLLIILLAFFLNPVRILHYSSRLWLLKLVGRLVSAPFHHVGFADFWLGDQLNSLTVCLVDYEFIVCFYLTNHNWSNAADPEQCMEKDFIISPIVRCMPAWFRFAQCLRRYRDTNKAYPFLVNAGKYATSFFVVLFGTLMSFYQDRYVNTFDSPYVWGYLFSYTVSTVYCFAWDMLKDFGVFAKFSGEHIFLREQIVYSPSFYYFAIIEDLLLRLLWVPGFYLVESGLIKSYDMATIAGILEVIRRYIWNYFRLENEHLFNAGMFRAVRDISIQPIEPKDQITLQRMMDEVDGVQNRQLITEGLKQD